MTTSPYSPPGTVPSPAYPYSPPGTYQPPTIINNNQPDQIHVRHENPMDAATEVRLIALRAALESGIARPASLVRDPGDESVEERANRVVDVARIFENYANGPAEVAA